MKLSRDAWLSPAAFAWLCLAVSCSSDPPGGGQSSTGGSVNPATGGAPATGGTAPTTGGVSATGGVVSATGGSTGGIPSGTGGIASGTGGSSSGGAGGGGASSSGGSSGSGGAGASSGGTGSGGTAGTGGAGGKGGAGGAAGAAGSAGGPARPEAELDGAGWTMKCTKNDTGNLCYLLPAGQTTCPSGGYTSVDRTLHFGGTPGTIYDVTIHFQGTHEAGDYNSGTAVATMGTATPSKPLLRGATHVNMAVHTWLSMEVSEPAATYNPNSGGGAGSVQIYDYTATIQIAAGATIKLKGSDYDCLMHRYCQGNTTNPCKGLVVEGLSPADNPIDGSFLNMDVTSVVAAP